MGLTSALIFYIIQNAMLSLRFAHLTRHKIGVLQCFRVSILCEFTSAVTPSAVGGSGLAFVYLNREGVTMGRSIFTMFASLMADEGFLGISSLLVYLLLPTDMLFCFDGPSAVKTSVYSAHWLKSGMQMVFLGSTLMVCLWTLLLYVLLLHRPQYFSYVLTMCCRIPFLRRFRERAEKYGNDMRIASSEAKNEGWKFWTLLWVYTAMAWMSRFAIVVAILIAFGSEGEMIVAWIRQWVIWMVSMLSPSPGGSGIAEIMFRMYYSDFLPDVSLAILAAMLWRLVSYYPYLLMGAVIIPKCIKR